MLRGMFRKVQMSVEVGESVVFVFAEPLSITSLHVSKAEDELVWGIIASEFQPVEVEGGSVHSWPIDQAPPEILAMLEQVGARAECELADHGPRKPPLSSIVYGQTPAGYREDHACQKLARGEYHVIVFGEQGTASASFTVVA